MNATTTSNGTELTNETLRFATDVKNGLSSTPKKLSSKYFYDRQGDALFQQIMAMPEYYLTDCEREIFDEQAREILNAIGDQPFELIELGAGDGTKTQILLKHFIEESTDFVYRPVDISANVLEQLELRLKDEIAPLKISPLVGDYFKCIDQLHQEDEMKKVILFLGANIGNYTDQQATDFLRRLHDHMSRGDILITGFDLKKSPEKVLAAYNDAAGHTARFNLNLLARINRELQADFDLDNFKHWESYNPVTGEARSFLVSSREQEVFIGELDETFKFDLWEAIDVEISRKYSLQEIELLARNSGFHLKKNFRDQRNYFVDSLWDW